MPEPALADLRVLDLSRDIAGVYAAKLLADFGAGVIKVEPPEGDPVRRLGPFPGDLPDPEKAGLFLFLNTNKRSLTLDVSTVSGQVVLRRLLAKADVLIEDFAPGTMSAWGLGYDDLSAEFPGLVYASVTPFGQSGPYSSYGGNALTALAQGGLMYVTGDAGGGPQAGVGDLALYQAGVQLWLGVLAALAYRDATGEGQQVDVSTAEAVAAGDEYSTALYAFAGAIVARAQGLTPPFATEPTPKDLLESEHLRARGFFVGVEHPVAGFLRLPGPPFVMSETPGRAGRAPRRGEHNAEVLTADAGYEVSDLTILSDRGII